MHILYIPASKLLPRTASLRGPSPAAVDADTLTDTSWYGSNLVILKFVSAPERVLKDSGAEVSENAT